ncbi:MAG: transposase [Chromatiaceae bacterium]
MADTSYHRAVNVACCEQADLELLMPEKREGHNQPLAVRSADDPEPPEDATPVEAMAHRIRTAAGKALYAKHKSTVETVFGIIKHLLGGLRQFLPRGRRAVQGEWAWDRKDGKSRNIPPPCRQNTIFKLAVPSSSLAAIVSPARWGTSDRLLGCDCGTGN